MTTEEFKDWLNIRMVSDGGLRMLLEKQPSEQSYRVLQGVAKAYAKQENKELRALLKEATSNNGESATFDERVKQTLKI